MIKYERRNNLIMCVDAEGKTTALQYKACKSINEAKRESRALQKQYGAGCMRVDHTAEARYASKPKIKIKPRINKGPALPLDDALALLG